MSTLSGKDGTVSMDGPVADATGWNITESSNNPSYGSSDTAGWKNRVAGVKDVTGTFQAKYNGPVPVRAGDDPDVSLTVDGSATYGCESKIDQVQLEVDMDDGDVVGYSADFGGNSALTVS